MVGWCWYLCPTHEIPSPSASAHSLSYTPKYLLWIAWRDSYPQVKFECYRPLSCHAHPNIFYWIVWRGFLPPSRIFLWRSNTRPMLEISFHWNFRYEHAKYRRILATEVLNFQISATIFSETNIVVLNLLKHHLNAQVVTETWTSTNKVFKLSNTRFLTWFVYVQWSC
jgi:hypothetical protein